MLIIAKQPLGKNMTMFKGVGEIIEDRTHKLLLPPKKIQEIEKLKKRKLLLIAFEDRGLE